MFYSDDERLIYRYDAEIMWIELWGCDALRVRATKQNCMPLEDWAIAVKPDTPKPIITMTESEGTITNGRVRAVVSKLGKLVISQTDSGKILLEEYMRNRRDLRDPKCSAIEIEAREFKPISRATTISHSVSSRSIPKRGSTGWVSTSSLPWT